TNPANTPLISRSTAGRNRPSRCTSGTFRRRIRPDAGDSIRIPEPRAQPRFFRRAPHPCQQIVEEKFLLPARLPLAHREEFCFLIRAPVEIVFATGMFNPMQTLHTMPSSQPHSSHHSRYSDRNMAKPINFFCVAPEAQSVTVVGDFNEWRPQVHPMQQQSDGCWQLKIPL